MAGIPTTTPDEIRSALVTLIEAITPRVVKMQECRWHYVEEDDITGAGVRTFQIMHGPPSESFDAFHGAGGTPFQYEMRIGVSYAGLGRIDVEGLVAGDIADLWRLLHPLTGGENTDIPGLLSFTEPLTPDYVIADPGKYFVDYVTTVRFKQAN